MGQFQRPFLCCVVLLESCESHLCTTQEHLREGVQFTALCFLTCSVGLLHLRACDPPPPPSPVGRGPMKPLKLKRVAKLKEQEIVSVACGAHTTAMISKDGKLFMFGSLEDDLVDSSSGESDNST